MKEVAREVVELPNGMLLCTGTKQMDAASGDHVRGVDIRLPPMRLDPVAVLSVVCSEGEGPIFGVYSVKFGYVDNETQVAVEAQNLQNGQTLDPNRYHFFCSYVVVGKRLDKK